MNVPVVFNGKSGHSVAARLRVGAILAVSLAMVLLLAACTDDTSDTLRQMSAIATAVAESAETPVMEPEVLEQLTDTQIVAAQEQVIYGIYQSQLKSVVHIKVSQRVSQQSSGQGFGFPFGFGQTPDTEEFFQEGEGSGFVWDRHGHILTNHHVVVGAKRITVTLADGTVATAEVLGTDPDSDIAVLKVDLPADSMVPVSLGDSSSLRVGQTVLAIGNPFGQQFTLTSGIISAVGRTIQSGNSRFSVPEVIQTDAAINPGNSGGPLLDREGRVIGINTQIISRSGSSSGIGFSIPIDTAKLVVPELISAGRYEYAFLGINGVPFTEALAKELDLPSNTRGALVVQVVNGSPADEAGLKGSSQETVVDGEPQLVGGDVIVEIDGAPIGDMSDLIAYMVGETRPGDKVELTIVRDGKQVRVEVVLGTRPRE